MLLGCIADDFTGACDLADTLTRAGMRTVQAIGVPDGATAIDADAPALKFGDLAAVDFFARALAATGGGLNVRTRRRK